MRGKPEVEQNEDISEVAEAYEEVMKFQFHV